MSPRMTSSLGLGKWRRYRQVSLGLEIAFLVLIVVWGLISVSRLLVSVKKNYLDAYDKHKSEYTQMAVVIVLSSLTMMFLNILDMLSFRCGNKCNSLLNFPNTQAGLLVQFLADVVPSIAFIYVNQPTDFMLDFNKYPENCHYVSIVQFHDYHRFYENLD